MILAVVLFSSSERIVCVILMSEIIFPLIGGKLTDVIDAVSLADKNSIIFTLKSSLSEEKSSAEQDDSSHKVDDAEEDHESELILSTVTYFFHEIEESLGNFLVSSYLSLSG